MTTLPAPATQTFLIYIDESGDPGFGSPAPHYVLSGFIVPAHHWRTALTALVDIRRKIKQRFNFPMRLELKGSALFDPRYAKKEHRSIYRAIGKRNVRLSLYRFYLRELANLCPQFGIHTFSIHANKALISQRHHHQRDVLLMAWEKLYNRFDLFLQRSKPPGIGLIIPDETENKKVRLILRRMRYFHPITSRSTAASYQANIQRIIEDPFFSDSANSYFIQTADFIAHAVYRFLYRRAYRRYRPWELYPLLEPCILKQVTRYDPYNMGIVPIPQP